MANRANDTPLALTLREMRSLARRRRFWAGLLGVIVVLSLTGPFDTYGTLSLPARAAYWAVAGAGSFGLGMFCSVFVACWAERVGLPERLTPLAGGVVAGVPVALLIAALNRVAFGGDMLETAQGILPYAMVITAVVALLYELLTDRQLNAEPAAGDPAPSVGASVLLEKLPPHLEPDIVCVQAQDHYVKVTTPQGSALILMRIGDAEQDLAGLGGLRVHRSWWVSRRHAVRIAKRNGRDHVITSLGTEIPIGRAYRKHALKLLDKALHDGRSRPVAS